MCLLAVTHHVQSHNIMCVLCCNQACPSILHLRKALSPQFLSICFLWYFIACFSLLDVNVTFRHFPCRFILGVFFKIVTLLILETCQCYCVCFLVNLFV